MELRIEQGAYVERRYGGVETVTGAQEAAQRITMKLTCPRGSFLPMPDFGSRLYLLYGVKPSERRTAAEMYITEALAGEREAVLRDLEVVEEAENGISLALTFEYRGETMIIKTAI